MNKAYQVLNEEFSIQELLSLTNNLSQFHRIQGTPELEKAGEYIASVLESIGRLEAEIKWYDYGEIRGLFGSIAGWWVRDGELRLIKPHEELLHSFKDSRTSVIAHSPGGVVEAEVVHIGNGEDPLNYEKANIEGNIVLAYGNPYLIYKQAAANGALGILVYRERGPEDAVPYMGLLFTRQEAREAKAPALAISRKTARRLITLIENGEKPVVQMRVEAGYRDRARMPVISTTIGEGKGEIHLCAHYCHPAGTVNDNISGVASLIELALALARAIRYKRLAAPEKHTIRFIWFPEYTGSLAYMTDNESDVVFCVNLDMIGERQELTGSTLNFIRPPPRYFHPYEAIFYFVLRRALTRSESVSSPRNALSYRFDVIPYGFGSDHDVYLQFGVPSVMINQWPDRFYHTDQDTLDKFDPQLARLIATSVGAAAYIVSKRGYENEIKMLVKAYFYEYMGQELSSTDEDIYQHRYSYLMRTIGSRVLDYIREEGIKMPMGRDERERSPEDAKKYVYQGPLGLITMRALLRKLDPKTYDKLKRLTQREKFLRTVIASLIPLYMRRPLSIRQLEEMIEEDYGMKVSTEVLAEIVNVLVKAGLVRKVD